MTIKRLPFTAVLYKLVEWAARQMGDLCREMNKNAGAYTCIFIHSFTLKVPFVGRIIEFNYCREGFPSSIMAITG